MPLRGRTASGDCGIQFWLEAIEFLAGDLCWFVLFDLLHLHSVLPFRDCGVVANAGCSECASALLLLALSLSPAEPPQQSARDGQCCNNTYHNARYCTARETTFRRECHCSNVLITRTERCRRDMELLVVIIGRDVPRKPVSKLQLIL